MAYRATPGPGWDVATPEWRLGRITLHCVRTVRVIPCLDVDNGRVVKGVNFVGLRDAGDPVELAARYDAEGADEIIFLDITASSDDRDTMLDVVAFGGTARNDIIQMAAVAEKFCIKVRVIAGRAENQKLTTMEDIHDADRILTARANSERLDVRVGQGIDFHEFEAGDGVVLCGVKIPHDKKLKGHSDADAAMHALTDAILGALGEGDIGTHFPPSDPQWKGVSSSIFLKKAVDLMSSRNGIIANVDVTILAEVPRVGPHIEAMKDLLSPLLHLSKDRIAIKATTTEQLGAIGRREGLAAFATATVRLP